MKIEENERYVPRKLKYLTFSKKTIDKALLQWYNNQVKKLNVTYGGFYNVYIYGKKRNRRA